MASLALTALIFVTDYLTDRELRLAALYLLPVCLASWVVGRAAGLSVAAFAAVACLVCDWAQATTDGDPLIMALNALMLLMVFVGFAYLLTAFWAAHHNLEDAVNQRTVALQAEIAERQRMEAAKLQSERLAVAGTVAAQVAHEIRNPLGSITLNLDLVNKEIDSLAETSDHRPQESFLLLRDIREEVRRIEHVVEAYLRFSRLPKLNCCPLALNEFLDHKIAFLRAAAGPSNVELCTSFDHDLSEVSADAEQLWQAVLNIVRNGIEAMPAGGILTISTQRDAGQAVLRVRDTGNRDERGTKAKPLSTVLQHQGRWHGLGLPLVQQIVREHGGYVECASVPGEGSTFSMHLPLAEEP